MARRFVVEMKLDRVQLGYLQERAAEPGVTVDMLHEWIGQLGYKIHRSAVYSWWRHFKTQGDPADTRLIVSALRLIVSQQREVLKRLGGDPLPPDLDAGWASVVSALGHRIAAN